MSPPKGFRDRTDAGRVLAERLRGHADGDDVLAYRFLFRRG